MDCGRGVSGVSSPPPLAVDEDVDMPADHAALIQDPSADRGVPLLQSDQGVAHGASGDQVPLAAGQ